MKIVGLMAGTSHDGIDAALVDIQGQKALRVKLLAFQTIPYSKPTLDLIRRASSPKTGTVDQVARLNFYLGELFAEAVLQVIAQAGLKPTAINLIGSHGQTLHHLPHPQPMGRHRIRATLQVAEPAIIAARTGTPVISDFRPADIAAGGQGAPLVPYVDFLLFRHPRQNRILLNLGGIANLTLLPAGCREVSRVKASDSGPGNMVSDELVRRMSRGRERFDRRGGYAEQGRVIPELLAELLRHPFFRKPPPKSTGREEFGTGFVDHLLARKRPRSRRAWLNLIATAAALTAHSVYRHYRQFYAAEFAADEVIVSGGGVNNRAVMRKLSELFAPATVMPIDALGVPADAKEAIAFAVLAYESWHGRPGNLPGATGAGQRAVLGKLCWPLRCRQA